MIENWLALWPQTTPDKTSTGLDHADSVLCWCDPIIEMDKDGQELVFHREVTWN